MSKPPLFPHTFFLILLLSGGLLFSPQAFAQNSEKDKISYLLNAIASSDLVFIRNGKEYTGGEARAHLKKKLAVAGNSIQTTEDFITHIASESSFTNIPYRVRLKDGTEIKAERWLRAKLANLD